MATLRTTLLTLLALLTTIPAVADDNQTLFAPFQMLLERHLTEKPLPKGGLTTAFRYQEALQQRETHTRLREQAEALSRFDTSTLEGKQETTAFWINAYNFFMVYQILTDQPNDELVSSVWDYGGRINPFQENIFQQERFTVGGTNYSLDQIEKDILLGAEFQQRGWKDARVHFAVNCASVGCPPLRQSLYTEDNLETMLTENTRLAFNTPRHLTIEGGTLKLTALFDWYRDDFRQEAGSVRMFIRQWADSEVAEAANQTDSIAYIDYDWALNSPDNVPEW